MPTEVGTPWKIEKAEKRKIRARPRIRFSAFPFLRFSAFFIFASRRGVEGETSEDGAGGIDVADPAADRVAASAEVAHEIAGQARV